MRTASSALRRGFTLIEVLVATVIMVVIILAVVTIATDTFKAYDRAVSDLSTQSEARGVLDAMENDFQTAVIRPDGRCWMEIVVPGGTAVPGLAGVPPAVGNLRPADHPIVMLFSSPSDRPRWSPERTGGVRVPLRGDVCAVTYRIGQRSPFDMPGELIQQIYGVYRTVIDPESTFREAIPVIMSHLPENPRQPWNYWTGATRRVPNYSFSDTGGAFENKVLTNASVTASPPCWTLDDQNFIGSNVVAMNLIFWCTSSLPASGPAGSMTDPAMRHPQMLRPVILAGIGTEDASAMKFGSATVVGGYMAAFRTNISSATVAAAPVRYAPASGAPVVPAPTTVVGRHPYDHFGSRLRVFSDRMYPDGLGTDTPPQASKLTYLPYSLRGVEISLTVLTPEGSKELRALQHLGNNAMLQGTQGRDNFRRIVYQHGRSYTRYVRLLGNGG